LKLKYIRYQEEGLDCFIVFPELTFHRNVKIHLFQGSIKLISAGFIEFSSDVNDLLDAYSKALCYGESNSLKLKSLPEDSKLATKQFFGE